MMKRKREKTIVCPVCKQRKTIHDVMPGKFIRESVAALIREKHPKWSTSDYICLHDLNHFRAEYVERILKKEKGELSNLEVDVVKSLKEHELLTKNINAEFERQLSFGERVSDKVADFGGSWKFIISFSVIIAIWISVNGLALIQKPFDPYPYILLNLVLSCIAAFQAPIIMMSQNRQESKDRMRSEHDYAVNLKAELEIRHLHTKIDQLMTHQWDRLLEIQQIEMELMDELVSKNTGKDG
jgi:uncharacterized membrane protein